jgi:hypothetical protein
MSENLIIRTTSIRSNNPDKHADLHNSVGCELMQLHMKFVKYIQKHRVRRYAKASSEKILEHNCSFSLGTRTDYAWWPGKPLQKKAKGILEIQDATSHDFRPPEIITHNSRSSFRPNFRQPPLLEAFPLSSVSSDTLSSSDPTSRLEVASVETIACSSVRVVSNCSVEDSLCSVETSAMPSETIGEGLGEMTGVHGRAINLMQT